MRKYIVFIIFIVLVTASSLERYIDHSEDQIEYSYRDDFNSVNRDFWYVGEWQTLFTAYEKVSVKNGILNMSIKDTDRGPFMLSKPLPVKEGDIVTIKRRVKIHYANENFTGGLGILETDALTLKPYITDQSAWSDPMGNGVVLVEHVHNFDEDSERPGRDVFRVLAPTWKANKDYVVVQPIFDDWFEETLEYDTTTNMIKYSVNDDEYRVRGQNLNLDNIRIFMHSYGFYTGHYNKIDWLEVTIKKAGK